MKIIISLTLLTLLTLSFNVFAYNEAFMLPRKYPEYKFQPGQKNVFTVNCNVDILSKIQNNDSSTIKKIEDELSKTELVLSDIGKAFIQESNSAKVQKDEKAIPHYKVLNELSFRLTEFQIHQAGLKICQDVARNMKKPAHTIETTDCKGSVEGSSRMIGKDLIKKIEIPDAIVPNTVTK